MTTELLDVASSCHVADADSESDISLSISTVLQPLCTPTSQRKMLALAFVLANSNWAEMPQKRASWLGVHLLTGLLLASSLLSLSLLRPSLFATVTATCPLTVLDLIDLVYTASRGARDAWPKFAHSAGTACPKEVRLG